MIIAIEGDVVHKSNTRVDIKLSTGITYGVFVSQNTILKIKEDRISLFIKEIIKEDSYTMYGFKKRDEQELFEKLIKLNGIGAKVAIAVCSTYTPKEFVNLIHTRDTKAIKKVPSIGEKVANRMMVELANVVISSENDTSLKYIQESYEALLNLGFTKAKIDMAFKKCKSKETASLIKEALKIL